MKKTTVTIGIPAYNEEQNIEAFLRSIGNQKIAHFVLTEVLVYSDASSDNTNLLVRNVARKNPRIKLIKGTSRKGKYFRVNELFARNKSDVLVILDADIAMKSADFLDKLVTALISDRNAVMTAAQVELIKPASFTARVLYTSFVLSDMMRLSVPGYDIAPNFHGAATAYKKNFIKNLAIPSDVIDPHLYIYLSAKKSNGFRYCPEAVILQNPPSTIKDVKQLMQRSIGKKDAILEKIFGKDTIQAVHYIPRRAKFTGVWKCFLQEPVYTPIAMLVSFYLGKLVHVKKIDNSPIWEINTSTKKKIAYAK
jgi:glycosyltransferase involved in cell wall biosynthesis